jgi:hypothetical protein
MQRLGANGFHKCGICGMPGHQAGECPLATHYHAQAVRAVLAGKATPDDIREAYRPVAKREGVRT